MDSPSESLYNSENESQTPSFPNSPPPSPENSPDPEILPEPEADLPHQLIQPKSKSGTFCKSYVDILSNN